MQPCRVLPMELVFEELDSPEAPKELDKEGKAEWNRIYPILKSKKLITKPDLQLLISYCWIVSRMKYIRKEVTNKKIIVFEHNSQGDKVQKVNKYISAYKDMFNQMVTISARFGFSPADRTKINLPANPKDKEQELENQFIRKHG